MKPYPYQQGNLDNLCGLYASINSTLLATEGLIKLNKKRVRSWFELMISDLYMRRKLLKVHQEGSPVELIESYLYIIKTNLADEVNLTCSRPFPFNTKTSTAIKKLSVISQYPNTSVIIGIEGFYDHWSVVDKITKDRIYLKDSDGIRFLNIRNIPKRYDLTVEDTLVVKAKTVCKQSIPPLHTQKSVQTKSETAFIAQM